MKQNQAHDKPNKANPPTESQKKKKKKTNTELEIKLTHRTHCHIAAENTEKTNPQYTEIVYTDYNLQSKSKTNQKQYTMFIIKNKKNKIKNKKPQYRASVPKRQNQTKTPILAPRSP